MTEGKTSQPSGLSGLLFTLIILVILPFFFFPPAGLVQYDLNLSSKEIV